MVRVNGISNLDYSTIVVDDKWNDCDDMELTMHTIHSYPAKFPAFMASRHLNMLEVKWLILVELQIYFVDAERLHWKLKIIIISFGDVILIRLQH